MSGTGKSSVVAELQRQGYTAHDLDDGFTYLDAADGRWHWDLPRVRALLHSTKPPLFVAGCSEEQALLPWDVRILLTAPADVILRRIDSRSGDGFGRAAHEREQVLSDLADVEPLLRQSANVEVDTTRPLAEVVRAVLQAAGEGG
jgi:broad-specificity NMP kinase